MVLTIELEGALAQMPGSLSPSRMWSPYRQPLAKFLNKYSADVSQSVFGSWCVSALEAILVLDHIHGIVTPALLYDLALSSRHAIHQHVLSMQQTSFMWRSLFYAQVLSTWPMGNVTVFVKKRKR